MTEHNIFDEIREDIERQKLEDLWKKYSGLLIAIVAAIVLGTAGSSAYHAWKSHRDETLSGGYMAAAKIDPADTAQTIDQLQKYAAQNGGTNQADFALLRAGTLAADKKDMAQAIQDFDAVAADSKADPAFSQLGALLSVQAQMDSGDPAALSARLDPLTAEHGAWRFAAMEAQGYLALKAGNTDKAKTLFTTLSQDARVPQSMAERAADILRSLN